MDCILFAPRGSSVSAIPRLRVSPFNQSGRNSVFADLLLTNVRCTGWAARGCYGLHHDMEYFRNRPQRWSPIRWVQCGALSKDGDAVDGDTATYAAPSLGLYRPFLEFATRELGRQSGVSCLTLQEEFTDMVSRDGAVIAENFAFESSKIRYFRSTYINGGPALQVLNVAGFAKPEYDIPIFCADFFSNSKGNFIVLDLNPLYNTSTHISYKKKYFDDLMVLANKHIKVLPWGDKLTAESVQFFSPMVLWTKAQYQDLNATLYPAFQDYLRAWLSLVDKVQPSEDSIDISRNKEAQHRYLSWRTTKDPGRPLLTRLFGEELAEKYIEEVLFHGVKNLGSKSFLDYFPEYKIEGNVINRQRSVLGKSFSTRPWDENGNLCET